jgi:leader peptidase (prepilin peptidase)/N-methyltransferase
MNLFLFIIGLAFGSFFNVCISRIPQGKSIIYPPSRCEVCNTKLKPLDLVPVASFLLLRGKCRYCGSKLSWRHPGIEFFTGILFVMVYQIIGLNINLIIFLFLLSLLLIISFIDIDYYCIPNSLIIVGLGIGVFFQIFFPYQLFLESIGGFFLGGGILFIIALVSRGGMGGGDIKLGGLIGFFLGWKMTLLSLFIAAFLSSITGIFFILLKKKSRKDPIPFGPFLSIGTFISILWGNHLLTWYLYYFVY